MRLLHALFGTNLADDDRARFDEAATEVHATPAFIEALQMSHSDLANLLRSALRTAHPSVAGARTWVYTRDVYDTTVVYELSGPDDQSELYQRNYTIANGAVTLGEPVKVIAVTQYVAADTAGITTPATVTQVSQPAAEADQVLTSDLVPLVEKAVKADGTAEIRIIAPGQGSSGFYPADVLMRDGPKVFTEGTQIYLDHPSVSDERERPERSVKDLAGALTGPAVWREDGLYAPVKFIDSVAPHIGAIAPISGMSIRASGKAGTRDIGGKKVRTIESIDVAHSVDVVTRAGAGGKVMDLIESARNGQPIDLEGDDAVSKEELEEARQKIADLEAWKAVQEQRVAEASLIREADTVVNAALAETSLPDVTRTRLRAQLTVNPPVKEDALDVDALKTKVAEAATAEAAYIASFTGGNLVRGMGGTEPPATPTVPTLEESDKRIAAALAGL